MPTDPDVVLAELDLGHVTVRAVRTRVSDELRGMLAAGGTAVGEEIVAVRWGGAPSGQPVLSERPTMLIIDDSPALVCGRPPHSAGSAEAVAPDGERVACTIAPGVWLVVLPNNRLGAELYPVLFQDRAGPPGNPGPPVNPGLPADLGGWPGGHPPVRCPACGSDAWDMVTAAWQGTGHLRNTRWGYGPSGPGEAFVCRVCGHEDRIGGTVFVYGRR